jgi:hypothetical protein
MKPSYQNNEVKLLGHLVIERCNQNAYPNTCDCDGNETMTVDGKICDYTNDDKNNTQDRDYPTWQRHPSPPESVLGKFYSVLVNCSTKEVENIRPFDLKLIEICNPTISNRDANPFILPNLLYRLLISIPYLK